MKEKIPKLVKFIVTNQLPFGKSLLKPPSDLNTLWNIRIVDTKIFELSTVYIDPIPTTEWDSITCVSLKRYVFRYIRKGPSVNHVDSFFGHF